MSEQVEEILKLSQELHTVLEVYFHCSEISDDEAMQIFICMGSLRDLKSMVKEQEQREEFLCVP